MELSSGDEFYIACDNIGTLLLSSVERLNDQADPVHGLWGDLHDYPTPTSRSSLATTVASTIHSPSSSTWAGGITTCWLVVGSGPDHELWKHLSSSNIMPFNLYMFKQQPHRKLLSSASQDRRIRVHSEGRELIALVVRTIFSDKASVYGIMGNIYFLE